jgi:hypothetical protein
MFWQEVNHEHPEAYLGGWPNRRPRRFPNSPVVSAETLFHAFYRVPQYEPSSMVFSVNSARSLAQFALHIGGFGGTGGESILVNWTLDEHGYEARVQLRGDGPRARLLAPPDFVNDLLAHREPFQG